MLIGPERLNINFIRYDTQAVYKDTIIRMTTEDNVFFFYCSQFKNTDDFLKYLKKGEELIVAGHKLRNGGYWLHWAILNEEYELKPDEIQNDSKRSLKYLAYSGAVALFSLFNILQGVGFILVIMAFLFSAILCSLFVKNLLQIALSPLNISLIMYLKERDIAINTRSFNYNAYVFIEKHRYKITALMNFFSIRKEKTDFPRDDFSVIQHNAEHAGVCVNSFDVQNRETKSNMAMSYIYIKNTKRKIKTPNNFHIISDGANNYYCKTHNSYLAQDTVTKVRHPFFVAQGDRVDIISETKNNRILGMYNHQDDSAYLFRPARYVDYNEMTIPVAVISSVALFLIISVPLSLLLWFFSADSRAFLMLISVSMIIPVFIFSLYLVRRARYFKSEKIDRYLLVQQYLQHILKLNNSRSSIDIILNKAPPRMFITVVSHDDTPEKQ